MNTECLEIPVSRNINDKSKDFDFLFGMWRQIVTTDKPEILFNFRGCRFLRPNAVAFIGGLTRLALYNNKTVIFDLNSLIDSIRVNLEQNGFLKELGFSDNSWDGNSVPYREDRTCDVDGYSDYLSEKWLGRGWVNINETLKDHITLPVLEAYLNVFDHASSPVGVITCGQHFPRQHQLQIAMVDFGIGIPQSVRNYKQSFIPIEETLRWAFTEGSSTKNKDFARGVGLKYLKEFIQTDNGRLEIYSDTGYVCIDRGGERFEDRQPKGFTGTLVQITLSCRENDYNLPTSQEYASGTDWF